MGFQTLIRTIYPPRCLMCGGLVETDFGLCGPCWRDTPFIGGAVCDLCGLPLPGGTEDEISQCDDCLITPRSWERGRATLLYADTGRRLVLSLKHGDRHDIAQPAARWMARSAQRLVVPDMIVTPVPLHWSRLLRRRYNQSALLARGLATELKLDHCPDLLQRHLRTPTLDNRPAEERRNILQQSIRAHPNRLKFLQNRTVLVVDDVMTSGATFDACAQALTDAGASQVFVIALTRVAKTP